MVLRGVFGLKRDEVHNEKLRDLQGGGAWGLIQGDHWDSIGINFE